MLNKRNLIYVLAIGLLFSVVLVSPSTAQIFAYIPVGDPEIVHTSFVDVVSGDEATLDIVIRNNADVDASFDIRVLEPCPCGIGYNQRYTFAAGEEDTLSLRIGCANVDETGTCKIKVVDVNNPDKYDIGYFNYRVQRAKECSPNNYETRSNCIYKCSSEGYWEEVKCCSEYIVWRPSDEESYGGWMCKEDVSIPGFESIFVGFALLLVVYLRKRKNNKKCHPKNIEENSNMLQSQ